MVRISYSIFTSFELHVFLAPNHRVHEKDPAIFKPQEEVGVPDGTAETLISPHHGCWVQYA